MHPLLYQVHARGWLREISRLEGRPVSLDSVPERMIRELGLGGFTHFWLMGVWTIGAEPRRMARKLASGGGLRSFPADGPSELVCGSPFAIHSFTVPQDIGGSIGLAHFRTLLHRFGIRLILDFVPNHLACDHPWILSHPHRFISADPPEPEFFPVQRSGGGRLWIAHGKDPYFPAWSDSAQLDWRTEEVQRCMFAELESIAARCDGVRVDMAMLILRDVFDEHWSRFPQRGPTAGGEFWPRAIERIMDRYPEFLFLAEVYWDREETLLDQGFHYAYDKTFYDRLIAREQRRLHERALEISPRLWARGARFLENHDEWRVSAIAADAEHSAWAVLLLALPGLRLIHHGQMDGQRHPADIRCELHPSGGPNRTVSRTYQTALKRFPEIGVGHGSARWAHPQPAWDGNSTHHLITAIQWSHPERLDTALVAVNLAPHRAQCRVALELPGPPDSVWELTDVLEDLVQRAPASELRGAGLHIDLEANSAHAFAVKPFPGAVGSSIVPPVA